MTAARRENTGLEIAVVGLAIRAPGAATTAAFWRNIVDGVEGIRFFTPDELLRFGRSKAEIDAEGFIPAHGALDDVDQFDPTLFDYSTREGS
ncbi:MAG: hypothetical protein FJX57_05525, partial [Alphaproteobacteria bacterium]|nr:hypothetical protein [Alphaproteobacteria bacterium]